MQSRSVSSISPHYTNVNGADIVQQIMQRFLYTKSRKEQFKLVSPLTDGAQEDKKNARVKEYMTGRNLVAGDYSSRLSPYLASGVLSGRMVCNEAKNVGKGGKLESGRDTGVGMWVQEVSDLSSRGDVESDAF